MNVYQLIYTSVQHSLSDNTLGLSNQPGLRVYSCSQGITHENIEEITRFASYKLPRNNNIEFSEVIGDPSVPELFPKIFRTLHLADGRFCAIQVVFSGVDFEGNPENFFAHAFVFDKYDDDFFPEQYFENPLYKTYLTTEEAEKKLIHYLPEANDIKPAKDVEERITEFIGKHKKELSYILISAFTVMTADKVKNICLAAEDGETVENYLLALKWLLPRDIAYNTGISTYNIYIPSDRQRRVVFNGTINGKNNITKQAIDVRKNCIYIDIDKTDFSMMELHAVFRTGKTVQELRKTYAKYNFTSVLQYVSWLETFCDEAELKDKLAKLKTVSRKIYALRAMELYEALPKDDDSENKFEFLKAAYENVYLFKDRMEKITDTYMDECIRRLCRGENYDVGEVLCIGEESKGQALHLVGRIPDYMHEIKENSETAGAKNKFVFLTILSQIKHGAEIDTWKEFFKDDKENISTFTVLAAMIMTGSENEPFSPPQTWTEDDMAETVAYFHSSVRDEKTKFVCRKYILSHENIAWDKYGISFISRPKTAKEEEKDLERVHRMLKKVGYIPYSHGTYTVLRSDVRHDILDSTSPLLLSRILDTYYKWRAASGNQSAAQQEAIRLRDLILRLKNEERRVYNYIFPKLALEIIETQCHYHETIVNTSTMLPSFWEWFLIGYDKCEDDDAILNYTRIYEANRRKLMRLPISKELKEAFTEE